MAKLFAVLLAACVVLQALTLWRVWAPGRANSPQLVTIDPSQTLSVDVERSCDVDVNLRDANLITPLRVELAGSSLILPLPVSIDNVTTSDELEVNLYNHMITGGDPIP